jgi:hypothetical protein
MTLVVLLLPADATEAPGTGVQLLDEDGTDVGAGAAAIIGIGYGPLHNLGREA